MLEEAVRAGRREALVALRDVLAGKLEKASPSGAALVAAQLRAVLSELDDAGGEGEQG